jgi:putative DNA primase/helicase
MTVPRYRPKRTDVSNPDLDEARRFCDILGPGERFAFQTYDDNPEKQLRNGKLASTPYGKLDEVVATLRYMNFRYAAVGVTLNRTDGKGRKKENVIAIRGVALDLDGAPLEPVKACGLKPHIVVQTSERGYHVIWRVDGLPVEKFAGVQWAIAKRYDGDVAIAKLTHCIRLPGFFHCKDVEHPFRVRILEASDAAPYTAEQILAEFPPETRPHKAGRSQVLLPKGVPWKAADEFATRKYNKDGVLTLRRHRGAFFDWRGSHYKARDESHIRKELYKFLVDAEVYDKEGTEPYNPTRSKVDQVLDALRAGSLLDAELDPPFWAAKPQNGDGVADNQLVFRNGVLDLNSRELRPHDPRWFCVNALPYDYDAMAAKPGRWLSFLNELFPGDAAAQSTLQEITGLALTGDTSHQKIFLLVGPKRSGKGTIGHVFRELVGRENAASPTMASLGTQFGLWPLIDRRIAIVPDARLDGRDSRKTVENLLSISGEDALTIDRKYLEHWTGRLSVRFLILTNELPRFADASGALASRFVILNLTNSFYGKEDLDLKRKLFAELPGILNWALEGLDRLRKRGRFEMPESSRAALQQMEDLASPIAAFVRERCDLGHSLRVEKPRLYREWQRWCEGQGEKPDTARIFGRNLTAAFSGVRPGHSSSTKLYTGIALKGDDSRDPGHPQHWRYQGGEKLASDAADDEK